MPKLASDPWISRIDAIARKMSSPKNRPTLSVAAAMAFTHSAVASSSSPSCFSAAATAIGATSGRTVCGWPATVVSPRALLQTVALEQSDDRQDDPHDGDVAVFVEAVPERRDHLEERHSAEQAG